MSPAAPDYSAWQRRSVGFDGFQHTLDLLTQRAIVAARAYEAVGVFSSMWVSFSDAEFVDSCLNQYIDIVSDSRSVCLFGPCAGDT